MNEIISGPKNSISVVIPFYRRIDTLCEAIESVQAQTLQPNEIIIVDDCSGEPYKTQLKELFKNEKLIHLENNIGVSGARNAGAKASTSTWIAFLDSDDLWLADKLESQINYLKTHKSFCGCHTGIEVFYPSGKKVVHGDKPSPLTAAALVDSNWVLASSLLIKREDYLQVNGFDENMRQTEDYDFSWRLISNDKLLGYVDQPLTQLRRGGEDHLSSNWKGFIKGHTSVVRTYSDYYKKIHGRGAARRHIAKYIYYGGYKCKGIFGLALRGIALLIAPDKWPKPTIVGTKVES